MGKKYIIEIADDRNIIRNCGKTTLAVSMAIGKTAGSINTGIELTPYTEPDLEKVRKEAYEMGYHNGYAKYLNKSYEEGLADAWEAAKKIIMVNWGERHEIFGPVTILENIFYDNTAADAIKKIKVWEEKKQEIKVGDEVDAPFGKAVVLDVCDNAIFYLYATGGSGWEEPEYVKEHKTGRHFPEIVAVLEKMRRGRNE